MSICGIKKLMWMLKLQLLSSPQTRALTFLHSSETEGHHRRRCRGCSGAALHSPPRWRGSDHHPPGQGSAPSPPAPLSAFISQQSLENAPAWLSWNQINLRRDRVPRMEEKGNKSHRMYLKRMQRDSTRIHPSVPPSYGKARQETLAGGSPGWAPFTCKSNSFL